MGTRECPVCKAPVGLPRMVNRRGKGAIGCRFCGSELELRESEFRAFVLVSLGPVLAMPALVGVGLLFVGSWAGLWVLLACVLVFGLVAHWSSRGTYLELKSSASEREAIHEATPPTRRP